MRWLSRSYVRRRLFDKIRILGDVGVTGAHLIRACGLDWCQSSRTNAREAIKKLIEKGFIRNLGTKRMQELVPGHWFDVMSDKLEENGFPRIDENTDL